MQTVFIKPWKPLSASGSKFFQEGLVRELGQNHPLCGRRVSALAVTVESDDFLFRLDDDGTYAQVHLTFTPNPPETSLQCPGFDSLSDPG